MSTTNVENSHTSHFLTQMVTTGKFINKETVEMDNIYKGSQISSLFSSTMQNNAACKSAIITQKCTETNVLANVLKRVNTLEGSLEKSKKRLKQALSVIKEKDNEIVRLKEQIRLLEDDQKTKKTSQVDISTLSDLTSTLESRIAAIESFLKGDPYFWYKSDEFASEQFCHCSSENCMSPDLDLLLQQINELNFEAGEVHICQKTKQGASFQGCQSISLIFYENGMQLEGHPFRDYADLRTQFFIKDIIDGYFPSELQCEYPRGVIFNVSDRRNEMYNDGVCKHLFKGQGCRLDVAYDCNSNCIKDSSLKRKKYHSNMSNCDDTKAEKDKNNIFTSTFPVTNEQVTQIMHLNKDLFKKRPDSKNVYQLGGSGAGDGNFNIYRQNNSDHFTLPNITIKDGHVYNKRFNKSSKQGTAGMNTSRIKYLNPGARSTDSCIQLKIRSINDKDLFILTMHVNEPVGKLRSYLPDDVKECNIMHFKDDYNRIYLKDNKSTLKECGILKNSVLVLCKPEQNVE